MADTCWKRCPKARAAYGREGHDDLWACPCHGSGIHCLVPEGALLIEDYDAAVERMVESASPEAIANLRSWDDPATVVEVLRRRCRWLLRAAAGEGEG